MGAVGLAVPIILPLEISAIVCGAVGVCIKFIRRKLTSKAQKHYEIQDNSSDQIKQYTTNDF